MKVVLFGATGMVGNSVLRECLVDPAVERVLSIGRSTTGERNDKLSELVHQDFTDFSSIERELTGYDACFFCLGVSSIGMSEVDYTRITFDFTMAAARTLVRQNPSMVFVFVSGRSTDSTEQGRSMWARVKGKTENALFALPFRGVYAFRPAYIHPVHGVASKRAFNRLAYGIMAPLYPVWKRLFPGFVTTTEHVGRAMLRIAKEGGPKQVLESEDIEALGRIGSAN